VQAHTLAAQRLFAYPARLHAYPAIPNVMKDFVSPETIFIDPAEQMLEKISCWNLDAGGKDVFLTSGDAKAMRRLASKAFACEIGAPIKVSF